MAPLLQTFHWPDRGTKRQLSSAVRSNVGADIKRSGGDDLFEAVLFTTITRRQVRSIPEVGEFLARLDNFLFSPFFVALATRFAFIFFPSFFFVLSLLF